jgi:hypothetical protein
MRSFNSLSGPWLGWSIQWGNRISERMTLEIREGRISGSGSDRDGEFEIVGSYSERTQMVSLTRRYSWTTEPTQSGVGIPYDYSGPWDGSFVSGMWRPLLSHDDGGPFEMWPASAFDLKELAIEQEDTLFVKNF